MTEPARYRCGFVAILGRPNAGKSTLMNALVGEKLAAVSGLPQTTRDRIHGILSGDGFQIIFADLPGLVDASDKLNEALRRRVVDTLNDADVVLYLVGAEQAAAPDADMEAILASVTRPLVLAVNKADTMDAARAEAVLRDAAARRKYAASLAISGRTGAGLPELQAALVALLPEGPPLYDPDDLTDRSMRFLAAEMIREKVFQMTHEEVPYATAVEIEEFVERPGAKWFVAAVIHLERDTQKAIIIGHNGERLKKISTAARRDIERLTGAPIYLQIHIKVSKDWRKNDQRLRQFGYEERRGKKGKR